MTPSQLVRTARLRAGLTQAEVARRAGTSQPNVNRIERGVSEPELSTLRRALRACGYDLELRLVKKRGSPLADLVEVKRLEILELARAHGARTVRLFGSVARREARASDVDVLVTLDRDRDVVDLAALRRGLEGLLNVPVDVTTLELLRPDVREAAVLEAVAL